MSGTNKYKEYLQHYEKEQNIKNIIFDPRHIIFLTTPPTSLTPKFRPHAKMFWTHSNIWPTPPRNLRNHADSQLS